MYYPYFRGKQYELITIRETAGLLARSNFVPIIETVRQGLSGISRTLEAITNAHGNAIFILNSGKGHYAEETDTLECFFRDELIDAQNISAGFLLNEEIDLREIRRICRNYDPTRITLIHAGYADARTLRNTLGNDDIRAMRHVFLEDSSGKLYRRHFQDSSRVLVRDGFEQRTNRDHPDVEFFSDLHITYRDEGVDGFGDFLIVGDRYSESGGPAYAIAIHLTFIDPEKDDAMYIHHFKSDRQNTPTDPAGKFAEALNKLVREVRRHNSPIFRTEAVDEFIQLHNDGHFPGLGYVKKLSMKHHLETLALYMHDQ